MEVIKKISLFIGHVKLLLRHKLDVASHIIGEYQSVILNKILEMSVSPYQFHDSKIIALKPVELFTGNG